MCGCTSPLSASSLSLAGVAWSTWWWPTSAAGAVSQEPMQGARTTRTPSSLSASSAASSFSAPASAQLKLSQTRTVTLGGPRLPIRHHVEMGVKRRNLVDLRHRDLQLFAERMQMPGGQASLLVLDQMQKFDQQRALARALAENGFDGGDLACLQHPALGEIGALAPAGARMYRAPSAASAGAACARVIHACEALASIFCLSGDGGIGIPYTKPLWCRARAGQGRCVADVRQGDLPPATMGDVTSLQRAAREHHSARARAAAEGRAWSVTPRGTEG